MSFPIQPYNPNNAALVQQQFHSPLHNNRISNGGDILGSLFGLANRLVGEILRNDPDLAGMSAFMGSDPSNPHLQVFGVTSMNMMQIAPGPNGQPQIVRAQDECRLGPDGVWQTKKMIHDPSRGIHKVEFGYFNGDQSEVIEHQLEPSSGQNGKVAPQRELTAKDPKFSQHWSSQPVQQPLALPSPQNYHYYPQQQKQQFPTSPQQSQFSALPHQPHFPTSMQQPQFSAYAQPFSPYMQQPQLSPYTQNPQIAPQMRPPYLY